MAQRANRRETARLAELQAVSLLRPIHVQEQEESMTWDSFFIETPSTNVSPTVPIAVIECKGSNALGGGRYDTNIGMMLRNSYEQALRIGSRRLYLESKGDSAWAREMQAEKGARPEKVITAEDYFDAQGRTVPAPAQRVNLRLRTAQNAVVSRVRVMISNIPANIDGDVQGIEMESVNVRMNESTRETIDRLFTSLLMKYFYNDPRYRGIPRIQTTGEHTIELVQAPATIKITYLFMFANRIENVRLITPSEAGRMNIPPLDIRGRRIVRQTGGQLRRTVFTHVFQGNEEQRHSTIRRFRIPGAQIANPVQRNLGRIGTLYAKVPFRSVHKQYSLTVPDTKKELCFPMAFVRAQCRLVDHGEPDEYGMFHKVFQVEDHHTFDIPLEEFGEPPNDMCTSFINQTHATLWSDKRDHVFERPETYELWEWFAETIHATVEDSICVELDKNDFAECLAAYSRVFFCNICLYCKNVEGRVMVETPFLTPPQKERFVYMFIDGKFIS